MDYPNQVYVAAAASGYWTDYKYSTTPTEAEVTFTEGEGTLVYDGSELGFAKGDTLFIPAQETSFAVKGNCEMILSRAK